MLKLRSLLAVAAVTALITQQAALLKCGTALEKMREKAERGIVNLALCETAVENANAAVEAHEADIKKLGVVYKEKVKLIRAESEIARMHRTEYAGGCEGTLDGVKDAHRRFFEWK